jgi:hypothetical protein
LRRLLGPLSEGAGCPKGRLGECPIIETTLPPPLRGTSLKEGGKAAFRR